jgi:hypothetical protein
MDKVASSAASAARPGLRDGATIGEVAAGGGCVTARRVAAFVWVAPGHGSTFRFTLPVGPTEPALALGTVSAAPDPIARNGFG